MNVRPIGVSTKLSDVERGNESKANGISHKDPTAAADGRWTLSLCGGSTICAHSSMEDREQHQYTTLDGAL